MASNTRNRIPVKWIRDGAKSAYEKQSACIICGSESDLELHHTNSITLLLEKWAKERNISLDSDEEVLAIRQQFIDDHRAEIYEQVFTLCNKHHVNLHRVFGKAPPLQTADKQCRWIEKQKAKVLGVEIKDEKPKSKGLFSAFY